MPEIQICNLFIDGREEAGQGQFEVYNPARPDEVVGTCASADKSQVEAAVEAAARAFPKWAALDLELRANLLVQAAGAIERLSGQLAPLLTREQGKILPEAVVDIAFPAMVFRYCASMSKIFRPRVYPDNRGYAVLRREPVGVVAVISPWNWPVALTLMQVGQALLAGNTVVVKPASYSPLTVGKLVHTIGRMFPPGVVNLVTGPGSVVGDVLCTAPQVRKISFTGSSETGGEVMAKAAATKKNLTLELGGNDAAIVLPDFPMTAELLQRMVQGVFMTTGQVCMAIKRIYVHKDMMNKFTGAFTEACRQIRVGDGLQKGITMGPLNNKNQLEVVQGLVKEARDRGAKVTEAGEKAIEPAAFEKGYFHMPTIITDVDASLGIVSCEQFGPAVPIIPYSSVDEAVEMANDTPYGLCSSVWAGDEEAAVKVASRLEAGYSWVNQHGVAGVELQFPYGGWKESGVGRTLGPEGMLSFTEPHVVVRKQFMGLPGL